ncbi:hypothetical protein HK097_004728, partial [Rhizophlyctis rosea]
MSFQGLRRTVAAINAHDHKELNVLIKEESDVIKQFKTLGKEASEASKYMTAWGKLEYDDFVDITDKLSILFDEHVKFINTLSERYNDYRTKLKDIRAREDNLYAQKQKVRHTQEKLKTEIKKGRPADSIRSELATVEREYTEGCAAHEGFKRATFQQALHIQFDGWMEYAQKVTIFATFGKYLSDQIPQGTLSAGQELPQYTGTETTKKIVTDFLKTVKENSKHRPADAESKPTTPLTGSIRSASPEEMARQQTERSARQRSVDSSSYYEDPTLQQQPAYPSPHDAASASPSPNQPRRYYQAGQQGAHPEHRSSYQQLPFAGSSYGTLPYSASYGTLAHRGSHDSSTYMPEQQRYSTGGMYDPSQPQPPIQHSNSSPHLNVPTTRPAYTYDPNGPITNQPYYASPPTQPHQPPFAYPQQQPGATPVSHATLSPPPGGTVL